MALERGSTPDAGLTELERLRRENKKLQREIRNLNSIIVRSNATQATRNNLNAMLMAEKSKQEQYMNLLLENSPGVILIVDQNGRFAYCTQVFLALTGIRSSGLITGRHYRDVLDRFPTTWSDHLAEAFDTVLCSSRQLTLEETILFPQGEEERHFSIQLAPMQEEDNTVAGAIAMFHDTTDLLLAKNLAEQASSSKSLFLANMSHEMRTPMNAIIGMTGIALSAEDPARKDYCLGKIDEASNHLLGVINDILDMSKIESGKIELAEGEFSFAQMLAHVCSVQEFRLAERRQQFFLHLDEAIPDRIVSDEQRLAQVITNLLSNAVKFTPEGGSITLLADLLEETDGLCTIRIEVRDDGIGIDPQQHARLFQSFEQADDRISRRFGGTGLGLAISKSLVNLLGGDIWVQSELGEGASFFFTVQVRRGSAQSPETAAAPDINWGDQRLLLVNPDADTAQLFSTLVRHTPLSLSVAEREAVQEGLPLQEFDFIFVDVRGDEDEATSLLQKVGKGGNAVVTALLPSAGWNLPEQARLAQPATPAAGGRAQHPTRFLRKPLLHSHIMDLIHECLWEQKYAQGGRGAERQPPDWLAARRILLTEDIEINREIVLALLEPTGIAVDCAENGREAVELVQRHPDRYDMIFMDIHMPELDGYEATRRIRALEQEGGRHIPIVAMTANVFREDIERCLEAGMDDHLGKPLDFDQVLDKLIWYLQDGG